MHYRVPANFFSFFLIHVFFPDNLFSVTIQGKRNIKKTFKGRMTQEPKIQIPLINVWAIEF